MRKITVWSLLVLCSMQMQAQKVLTLQDCRELAKSHNKTLQMAEKQVAAATALKKAAKTQYLPSIAANGGFLRNEKNLSLLGEDQYLPIYNYDAQGAVNYAGSWNNGWTVVGGSPVPLDASNTPFNPKTNPEKILWKYKAFIPKDAFEFDIKNVFVGNVSITQPLFLGGKVVALNKIAQSSVKLAEAQQDATLSETILNTDVAYWRIVSLSAKKRLADSYLNLLKRLNSNLDKAVAVGVSTKSEALSVKVKLNEAELSLLQAEDGLSLSRMALSQLCGLPLDASPVLSDETTDSLPSIAPNETMLTQEAPLNQRPELRSLVQLESIADAQEKIAFSRFLPNAVLSANYTVSNPNMFNGASKSFDGMYQIGVAVNMPLFHFGERVQTLRASKEGKNVAHLQLEEAKEKIELEVQQARFRLSESMRKATMTAIGKQKAEENLRYATLGYETGSIELTTLMEAQTAWLKACSDNIDAQIDTKLGNVTLEKALGNIH